MKARAMQGLFRVLHVVKVVIVAFVCLLIGFSARQLFDAYAKEMIPFLKEAKSETQVHVTVATQESTPIHHFAVE